MEARSPTAIMSASQRAKKSRNYDADDSPLAAWIAEVVETLNRSTGAVKVTPEHVTAVKEQLLQLNHTDAEFGPRMLKDLVEILGTNAAACRRLKSSAFALLVEVLLVVSESDVGARGLYILAGSLYEERQNSTNKTAFTSRLDLISQGCLLQLCDHFTNKSLPYSSRRWIGILVLELIEESGDSQDILAFMSTSKKAKLGSCILYEASEILRSIAGRILTVMVAAGHPIKQFFPSGTAEKLYEKYPGATQPSSQWDKTFQDYVDDIWEDICANNESNGEIQFAQNVAIEPPHPAIHSVTEWQRSIYIEVNDHVRVYMHSGKHCFDSAVDIPLTSIKSIATSLTPVDRAQSLQLVDVVITIVQSALCWINSHQASLVALRLTVSDQTVADGIVDCISLLLHAMEEKEAERQPVPDLAPEHSSPDSSQSSQGKKSFTDESLVLDGSYTVVNDSFVAALLVAIPDQVIQPKENVSEHQNEAADHVDALAKGKGAAPKQPKLRSIVTKAIAGKQKNHKLAAQTRAHKHTIEVSQNEDVDASEVLSSKLRSGGVIALEQLETAKGAAVKPRSIATESSDQLAGDHPGRVLTLPKDSTTRGKQLNTPNQLPRPRKKQNLKPKAPIRGLKTAKDSKQPHKQNLPLSKITKKDIPSLPATTDASKNSKHPAQAKESTKKDTRVTKQATNTGVTEDDIYDVSSSPPRTKQESKVSDTVNTIASIEKSDDFTMALQRTDKLQNPPVTAEAKFGQRMSEIFAFATAQAQTRSRRKPGNTGLPQEPIPSGFEAPVLSSPMQAKAAPLSKRGAIKARVHADKQAAMVPKSSPHIAADNESEPENNRIPLVDDHQARKAPLIAFGPQGPKNQGLSSAVKASRLVNPNEPNTPDRISDNLTKQSVFQKPSWAERSSPASEYLASIQPRVSDFEDSPANTASVPSLDHRGQEEDGMDFFDAGRSVTSTRSYSRVDVNGSPQPKAPSAPIDHNLPRATEKLEYASALTSGVRSSHRNTGGKKHPFESAFEDDTTLLGSGMFISSNRKARPAAPQDDLDFEARYAPHHPTADGTYVGVADHKVVDVARQIVDPFNNKLKRQDSDFSRRLRVSGRQTAESKAQHEKQSTMGAERRIQIPGTTLPRALARTSWVDVDTTLVNAENRPPRRSRRSRVYESSSSSSNSEGDAEELEHEPITPTPQQVWEEARKPHQQDLSDVLHHVVNGLLQQLFDKEPAIQAIADEYGANGAKIVHRLQSKLDADTQALGTHATSTMENIARSLQQSRAALQASSHGSEELDSQYKAWRARQHALQSLPFMGREHGRK